MSAIQINEATLGPGHPGTLTRWFLAGTFTVDMNTIFGPAKVGPRPFCADAEYLKPVE